MGDGIALFSAQHGNLGTGAAIIVRTGDPGEPEYTFSPLTYFYDHRIPIEVSIAPTPGLSSEEALDTMLVAIGEGIALDRTLGGLCDWLDTSSAGTEDIYAEGGGQPPAAPNS